MGAVLRLVPSMRITPVAITMSPPQTSSLHAAAGATRMKVSALQLVSSSSAMEAGRAADAGAGNADGYAVEGASVSSELAAVSHQTRVIKIFGNFGAALGVAGQKH